MLSRTIPESVHRLTQIGISEADAFQLRRIAMTLHRWHELECGDSNDYGSWAIERGKRVKISDSPRKYVLEHDPDHVDGGKPYMVHHHYGHGARPDEVVYSGIADREAGAKRRLARILKSYPHLQAYVQTDPRGAALYILRPGDVPEGADVSSCYSRGVAVYK